MSNNGQGAPVYGYPGTGNLSTSSLGTPLGSLADNTGVTIQCYWTGDPVPGPNAQGGGTDAYWDQIIGASTSLPGQQLSPGHTYVVPDAYIDTSPKTVDQIVQPCNPGASGTGSQGAGSGSPPSSGRPSWWCPVNDSTKPICSDTGAFQNDVPDDYKTATPNTTSDPGIKQEAENISLLFLTIGSNAHEFFQHYLDGSGADLNFDSTTAYDGSTDFSTTVDNSVRQEITQRGPGATTFDSGWNDYPPVGTPTSAWNNFDWQNAVGHGFYRVTGQLQQDGTWNIRLQLTSYYQFRVGVNFSSHGITVKGADMRRLEQIGWAKNYREVGTGNLKYNADGSPDSCNHPENCNNAPVFTTAVHQPSVLGGPVG